MTEYEQAALAKIRNSYSASKPLVEQVMAEHMRVTAMISMFRAATVLDPTGTPESKKPILNYYDAITNHLENMIGAIGAMFGVATMAHMIMGEHEEKTTEVEDER